MYRFVVLVLMLSTFISCSKNENMPLPPEVIPASLDGVITEFNLTPLNVDTLDKGSFFIFANNTNYRVDFDVASQAASNAVIRFVNDTILMDESREFANLGK